MSHRPLAEVTLRKYEKPFRLSGRDLAHKFCLSVGLLSPGESRDVVADVLFALVRKGAMDPATLEQETRLIRREHNLSTAGCAASNIRRQVRRLKDLFLVERVGKQYRLAENAPLQEVFTERIEKFYVPVIISRVKEFCEALERERCSYGENDGKFKDERGFKKV